MRRTGSGVGERVVGGDSNSKSISTLYGDSMGSPFSRSLIGGKQNGTSTSPNFL